MEGYYRKADCASILLIVAAFLVHVANTVTGCNTVSTSTSKFGDFMTYQVGLVATTAFFVFCLSAFGIFCGVPRLRQKS
jgi:hypothetical protein